MISTFTLLCSQSPKPFSSCKINSFFCPFKNPRGRTLYEWLQKCPGQLVAQYPPNLRAADLIPLLGTCLGNAFGFLCQGKEGYRSMFLTSTFLLSLSSLLSETSLPSFVSKSNEKKMSLGEDVRKKWLQK